MARDTFKVGVVGTGAIAQVVHLPTLSQLPGVKVRSVCDVDRNKAQALASRFGIERVCGTEQELWDDDGLDGVILCAPSHLHEPQAIAALEAGKHVLVEKPLALSAEGAQRAVDAARRADRTLMVAMNNRYRPDVAALKPFITGGELGDVFFLKGGAWNRKVRTIRPTWRHRKATAGGGALMDLGVQTLDLCLFLMDYPGVRRVVAHTHPGERMEVEDSATALFELENGGVIAIEVTWSLLAQRDRHYVQVLGTHGSAALPPLSVAKEVEQGLLDVTPSLSAGQGNLFTAAYREQLRDFVATSRGAREGAPPERQVRLMRLIELAYQSASEGRQMEVSS